MVKVPVGNQNRVAAGDLETRRVRRIPREPGVTNNRLSVGEYQLKGTVSKPCDFYRHRGDYATAFRAWLPNVASRLTPITQGKLN